MSRMNVRGRATRGAASVEMALSMIVLIPIFMYALFLDDLLRYSLDAQEAALSTVWDFTIQDYTKDLKKEGGGGEGPQGGRTQVQHNARLTFCDHESGANRTDSNADCDDTDHHKAVVAHVCWMNAEAKQVTCEEPDPGVGSLGSGMVGNYQSQYTKGGYIACSARAVVENYLLPETFLPQFGKGVKLSKENWKSSGVSQVHENAKAGDNDNAYFLKEQRLAILTDTWALTEQADLEPSDSSGEMYDRVNTVYRRASSYTSLMTSFQDFRSGLTDKLLNDMMLMMYEDKPTRPYLSIHPHLANMQTPANDVEQEGDTRRYFNQEWRDWDNDKNQNTYKHGSRGDWYMGCKDAESC